MFYLIHRMPWIMIVIIFQWQCVSVHDIVYAPVLGCPRIDQCHVKKMPICPIEFHRVKKIDAIRKLPKLECDSSEVISYEISYEITYEVTSKIWLHMKFRYKSNDLRSVFLEVISYEISYIISYEMISEVSLSSFRRKLLDPPPRNNKVLNPHSANGQLCHMMIIYLYRSIL